MMKNFRSGFFTLLFVFSANAVFAQFDIPQLDKSPLDVSYYPINYPMLKAQNREVEPLVARLIYSRPALNQRKIFGELLPLGQVWRLGANEATEIEFFRGVEIGGKHVKKGRYTLYAIPFTDKWTFILNKDLDIWGSFLYNQKDDVTRIDVPVETQPKSTENLSMFFEKADEKNIMLFTQWDTIRVRLPISIP